MSAIGGLIHLDGSPVDAAHLRAMTGAMAVWGPDGGGTWIDGSAGLAQFVAHRTPDAVHERGPLVRAAGCIVTAAARLDNRDELLDRFRLADAGTPDSELVARAYEQWGADAVEHLFGDWAFAAWHPRERRLFLARDQYGNTALHYYADSRLFAFASGLDGLLAVPDIPARLNEWRLSQLLTVWTIDGSSTLYEGVSRLAPSCVVTVTDAAVRLRQYWRFDDVAPITLRSDEEYVERFLELFSQAVRVRVRTTRPIAAQLSGGLDSGAVTSLAARELRRRGERITAFTSVPRFEQHAMAEWPGVMVNEWPAARQTAEWNTNVDHVAVPADDVTPLAAIARGLELYRQPELGAPNLYWNMALIDAARHRDCGVLLTGQMGNLGVSWPGEPFGAWRAILDRQPRLAWRFIRGWRRAHHHSWARTLRHTIGRPMRTAMAAALTRRRGVRFEQGPLIHPAFAARLDLARLAAEDAWMRKLALGSAHDLRFGVFVPGVSPTGATWHILAATGQIEARDPTADVRLLAFCIGVPDDLFSRPEGDRWLMRRAMDGIVPPGVLWGQQRGRQSADLASRLRADAPNVTAAVEAIAASPTCREYVNVAQIAAWWTALTDAPGPPPVDTAPQFASALMAGLFLVKQDG